MKVEFDVNARMTELDALDRSGLFRLWQQKVGKAPPNYTSMSLMRKVILWEEQSAVSGGIPRYLMRALSSAAGDRADSTTGSNNLRPGSLLVREWNGRTYQVEITDEGYRFDGREYRSLSAISRKITGTNWSGPRFFGLTARQGQAS